MRIGIRLGGCVIGAFIAFLGMVTGAQAAERVTTLPLGGSLAGQNGDHYYGVYVPTRFGGELTVKASAGKVVELGRRHSIPTPANGFIYAALKPYINGAPN